MALMVLLLVVLFWNTESYAAYTKGEPIKVGIFDMDGFHSVDEEGNLTGFCIDYLNVIADITGWKYEFVEVKDFMEGLELLEKQELDLIAPAMMTDARKEIFDF